MSSTDDLLRALAESKLKKPLRPPGFYAFWASAAVSVYAVAVQAAIGVRADFSERWKDPLYASETLCLSALAICSASALAYAMYPDEGQKNMFRRGSVLLVVLFIMISVAQAFRSNILLSCTAKTTPEHALPEHTFECCLYISCAAFVPAACLFALAAKGAVTHSKYAGCLAALSGCAVGCVHLRLSEATDSVSHLWMWHYLPSASFACLGAYLGGKFLRW